MSKDKPLVDGRKKEQEEVKKGIVSLLENSKFLLQILVFGAIIFGEFLSFFSFYILQNNPNLDKIISTCFLYLFILGLVGFLLGSVSFFIFFRRNKNKEEIPDENTK